MQESEHLKELYFRSENVCTYIDKYVYITRVWVQGWNDIGVPKLS